MAKQLYSLDITKTDTNHFTALVSLEADEFKLMNQQLNDIKNTGAFTSFTLTLNSTPAAVNYETAMKAVREAVPHKGHEKKISDRV